MTFETVIGYFKQMCRKIGCTSNRSIERTGVHCYSCLIHIYLSPKHAVISVTFPPLSYHSNITYNKSVRYKLNKTSEKTRGR